MATSPCHPLSSGSSRSIRTSFADSKTNELLAQGVPVRDVAEILGHSDARLTLSTYASSRPAEIARRA